MYPTYVMEALRGRRALEPSNMSQDSDILEMHKDEVFDELCDWEGLVHYGATIRRWVKDIYGIDLSG